MASSWKSSRATRIWPGDSHSRPRKAELRHRRGEKLAEEENWTASSRIRRLNADGEPLRPQRLIEEPKPRPVRPTESSANRKEVVRAGPQVRSSCRKAGQSPTVSGRGTVTDFPQVGRRQCRRGADRSRVRRADERGGSRPGAARQSDRICLALRRAANGRRRGPVGAWYADLAGNPLKQQCAAVLLIVAMARSHRRVFLQRVA